MTTNTDVDAFWSLEGDDDLPGQNDDLETWSKLVDELEAHYATTKPNVRCMAMLTVVGQIIAREVADDEKQLKEHYEEIGEWVLGAIEVYQALQRQQADPSPAIPQGSGQH